MAQDNDNAPDFLPENAAVIFLAEKRKGARLIAFTTEQQQQLV
jgi:hypothetical protein